MTNAEMNRRIAEMTPRQIAIVERQVRNSTYSPRELADLTRVRLAYVNAVFHKVAQE